MQKISRNKLSNKYNISNNQWQRRHDDLLNHLQDFFSIVEIQDSKTGYYYYEVPDILPDTIPKLPRKSNKQEKIADYEQFVGEHLSEDFEPMSKAKMSRDAIKDFAGEKYGHFSQENVCRVYVGPAMEKLGEKGQLIKWVNYNTYLPLTEEQQIYLKQCFSSYNITQEDVAEFGYEIIESGIIDNKKLTTMKERYENAMNQFKLKYEFRPVRARDWRKKKNEEKTFYVE